MRTCALACVLLCACVTPAKHVKPRPKHAARVETPKPTDDSARPDDAQREQVRRFLEATQSRDFEAAWRLLAEPLRDRYTPKRLEADFDSEPLVGERLARIRKAIDLPFRVQGRRAYLELSEGRVLELVEEPTGWHIATLE